MKDGEIITNTDEVNLALMEVLRELQIDKTKPNSKIEPFPDMRELCYEEAMALVERMSTNKAISTDLFSDVIFQPQFREKTAEVIQNLWSKESLDCLDMTNFEARLIPLNKKYPEIPKPEEFRPIVIMSSIIKLLEARTLESLQRYQVSKMHRSQVGFVPTLDIYVNIHRAIKRLQSKILSKKPVFCLFLDFKSAYNTVPHDRLFQKLSCICPNEEVQLLKAIYSRLSIRLGKEVISCNTGVAQGSMISPALFDIYAEDLLVKLEAEGWCIEDLLAYADDHLIICDSLDELRKAIKVVQEWCKEAKIKLNPNKSGILEVTHRRGRKLLEIGSSIEEIPVVESYRYLGLVVDGKLTGDAHLKAMSKKIEFLNFKLAPLLSKISITYRVNLWRILVQPLFKPMLAILSGNNQSRVKNLQSRLKGSLKKFAGLSKNTADVVIEKSCRVEVEKMTQEQRELSSLKWSKWCRYETTESHLTTPSIKTPLLLRNFAQYNNIQNLKCCKCTKGRLHPQHLKEAHGVNLPSTLNLLDELTMISLQKQKTQPREQLMKRSCAEVYFRYST